MNPEKHHVMLDLETVGNSGQSSIVAIGACKFSLARGVCHPDGHFSAAVDLQSCLDVGLTVDGSTVGWWMRQPKESRRASFPIMGALPIKEALRQLMIWLPDRCQVYTCGPDFDFAILNNALAACGMTKIEFWRSRCFRTAKDFLAQAAGVVPSQRMVKHEALQDAIDQAKTLCDLHDSGLPKMKGLERVRILFPWIGTEGSITSATPPPTASLDHETCWHCLAAEQVKPCDVDGSKIPLCPACHAGARRDALQGESK
jgi:exodeoxyribonuclease VIII